MEWKFDAITKQTTKVDPEHLEFFRSEALEDTVSALVREDIQNRLDAHLKTSPEPVRVRYYLSGHSSHITSKDSGKWLKGLSCHLNAPKCLQEIGSRKINLEQRMPYLVIEDFNTSGLQGDPYETSDPEDEGERNDFYWFVRNVGRTGKKAGDRGRWGLGKIVYPASSEIRSFFCYSVRAGDYRQALIGRSVLAIHAVDKTEYHSEGYFALFPDEKYPYFAVPEEDEKIISDFVKSFHVNRKSDETGLSLIIPFPEKTITKNSLVLSLIQHYFWEILRGTLEVVVEDDNSATIISCSTIDGVVKSWVGLEEAERKVTQNRLDFCRKADRMKLAGSEGFFELRKPCGYNNVKTAELFKSPEQLEKAKTRFRAGEIVAVECVVAIKKRDEADAHDASFLVYLQKDSALGCSDETFIRDGLTIIGERKITEPGIRALVLAEDPTITEFLGDAENPAHTRWLSTTKHFRGKYIPGNALLEYVKCAALRIVNVLGKVENELLEDLLDDLFGVPNDESGKASQKVATGKTGQKKPPPGGGGRNRYLETTRLESEAGFSVRLSPEAKKRPERVVIRVAYESEGGDPFKLYHPADFDFSDAGGGVTITTEDATVVQKSTNRIDVEPHSDEFRISVTGFDRNRDLRLDVRPDITKSDGEESK